MAGSLYLGSNKVCPAIALGGDKLNVGLEVDQNGKLIPKQTGAVAMSGFSDVGDYVFYQKFYNTSVTSADLSNLETISGTDACYGMFEYCRLLASVDLSNLETIGGYEACYAMFYACPSLTSVDLSNLRTIGDYYACYDMFGYCRLLASVDLSNLETIGGSYCCYRMFRNCILLKNLSFPSVKTISSDSGFARIIQDCSDVTIHFPSNMQSTVQGLSGYPDFGGTNTTLLFDLPPTA